MGSRGLCFNCTGFNFDGETNLQCAATSKVPGQQGRLPSLPAWLAADMNVPKASGISVLNGRRSGLEHDSGIIFITASEGKRHTSDAEVLRFGD